MLLSHSVIWQLFTAGLLLSMMILVPRDYSIDSVNLFKRHSLIITARHVSEFLATLIVSYIACCLCYTAFLTIHFRSRGSLFNERQLFAEQTIESASLKQQFRNHFHNISRIMDCIDCEKCRLWGKLQVIRAFSHLCIILRYHWPSVFNLSSLVSRHCCLSFCGGSTEDIHYSDYRRA